LSAIDTGKGLIRWFKPDGNVVDEDAVASKNTTKAAINMEYEIVAVD